MKVIAILNEKGGVAKTQTSINLSVGLSRKQMSVLLIDCDPQFNTTDYFTTIEKTVKLEDMINNPSISMAYETQYPNLDIIPCSKSLAIATEDMSLTENRAKIEHIRNILDNLDKKYDVVIVDCLPTLNLLTLNVLEVTDLVISPTTVNNDALKGVLSTRENIIQMNKQYDLYTEHAILFTQVNLRSKLQMELVDQISNSGLETIEQMIRFQFAPIEHAITNRKAVITSIAKTNKVGEDYRNMINEIYTNYLGGK